MDGDSLAIKLDERLEISLSLEHQSRWLHSTGSCLAFCEYTPRTTLVEIPKSYIPLQLAGKY